MPIKNPARLTITLRQDQMERLKRLSNDHDLSLSWMIREAVSDYLGGYQPRQPMNYAAELANAPSEDYPDPFADAVGQGK